MNGIEKIAYENIKGIFNWEVGGWYNCIQDDCVECIPDTKAEAAEIIYFGSVRDYSRPGVYRIDRAPKEVKLAGRDFIMKVIAKLLEEDEDALEIAEVKGW